MFSLLASQRAVIYPLLDLGLLDQVGGFLGEDELPETRPEPVPVILHHGHTVLWEGHTHTRSRVHKTFRAKTQSEFRC